MGCAWIFAGQGAEEPGMGLALARSSAEARAWLDEASRVTGVDVPRALERGGRALSDTSVLQPVLVAVGLGAASACERAPDFVLGHSLGELTAACWAASLPRSVAIELAATRGRAMAEAAAAHVGGMVALRGIPELELEGLLREGRAPGVLQLAAVNAPDELVVSGDREALAWLAQALPGRATALRVAGPWHSARMESAVPAYASALDAAFAGRALRARLVSACGAREVTVHEIPSALADGLVRPVRFLDAIGHLERAGVDRAVVLPPRRTTESLLRRAATRRWTIEDPRRPPAG